MLNEKSPELPATMTLERKALSVILSFEMEAPQEVSERNTD